MLLIWLQWINTLSVTQHISWPPRSFWVLLDRSQTSWCHCWLWWVVSVWLPLRSFSQTGKNSNLEVRNLYSDLTGSAVKSRNSQQLVFIEKENNSKKQFPVKTKNKTNKNLTNLDYLMHSNTWDKIPSSSENWIACKALPQEKQHNVVGKSPGLRASRLLWLGEMLNLAKPQMFLLWNRNNNSSLPHGCAGRIRGDNGPEEARKGGRCCASTSL